MSAALLCRATGPPVRRGLGPPRGGDTGSAALPLLAVALLLLTVGLLLGAGAQLALAGARARSAADLAALAAARHLGDPVPACREAARNAAANGAEVASCLVTPEAVELRVVVAVTASASRLGLPRQVGATARAGYPP